MWVISVLNTASIAQITATTKSYDVLVTVINVSDCTNVAFNLVGLPYALKT